VGDVKGKGIDAAVLTGMARHTIRGAAIRGAGPVAVLTHLNEMLIRHEGERTDRETGGWEALEPRFCTVVAIRLTRGKEGFQAGIACAGHPLPQLRHPDGRVESVGRPGTVLGIAPVIDVAEVTVALRPGTLLACFTDGVSECHEGTRFFDETGIARVLESASGGAAQAVDQIEAAARRHTPGGAIRDDMAILVARVPA
jgi:sigma-B regulation protein RsbU (phosphoserine phosphatase)